MDTALEWQRYRGVVTGKPGLAVEAAAAREGADAEVVALVARRLQLPRLVQTALLPVMHSFDPGRPEAAKSVLASTPPDPSYWPTAGWRTASPSAENMDAEQLAAMVAKIAGRRCPSTA